MIVFTKTGVGVEQTEGKNLRFQTKTDTCGRGFSPMHSEKKNAEFFFNVRKFYLGYVHSIADSFSWRFKKLTSIV